MVTLSERTQMYLKLGGLVLTAGIIAVLMYFLFFAHKPAIQQDISTGGSTPSQAGGLPSSSTGPGQNVISQTPGANGSGQLPVSLVADGGRTATVTLTTSAVTEPTLMQNGALAYYDPADGKFYSIDKNGNVKALADARFPQAENITFSADAHDAVIEFPDGSNVVYDFNKGAQVTLPAHWEGFSFSHDGSQVAGKSIATDPSARALVVTNADGSATKVVAPLGSNDAKVDVNWSPDGSVLGFSKTGESTSTFGQNQVFLIGADGKDSGIFIVNGTNFSAIWSPNSSHLLYSVADAGDNYRATLWYADKDGDGKTDARKAIPLKTLAEKCTFASEATAYCAVPTTMPAGGGSTPGIITASDNLYRVDLPSGRVSLVAIPGVDTQMFHLEVSPSGDLLYFTDEVGRLNYLRLK